ncbi:MAG: endonuclease III [Myxococcaceae bacterium]
MKSAKAKPKSKLLAKRRKKADPAQVLERLAAAIPDPHVELKFDNPWQLLIAVILSAQSTDRTINRVTPELFRRWPTPQALGDAPQEDVEEVVKASGFFRNKAKSIRGASKLLADRFGGKVPKTMDELLEVPGVARKTANVVLGTAHQVAAGIVVDTHAMRVSQRLGLTRHGDPVKIEEDLCRAFPQSTWIKMGHRLVLHGRHVCIARAPECERCALNELCPSKEKDPEGTWKLRAEGEAREMGSRAMEFERAAS